MATRIHADLADYRGWLRAHSALSFADTRQERNNGSAGVIANLANLEHTSTEFLHALTTSRCTRPPTPQNYSYFFDVAEEAGDALPALARINQRRSAISAMIRVGGVGGVGGVGRRLAAISHSQRVEQFAGFARFARFAMNTNDVLSTPQRQIRKMEKTHLTIEGMTCQHCVRAVETRLRNTPGVEVEHVAVGSADIRFDPSKTSVDDLAEAIADEGYTAFVS